MADTDDPVATVAPTGVSPDLDVSSAPLTVRVSGRRLTATTIIQLVGRLATLACGLGVTVALARGLGPERFGQFTAAFMFVGFFFELLDFGVTSVAVRQMAREPARRAELAGALVVIRGGGGLVLVVIGGLLTPLVLDDGAARIAALILLLHLPLTGFFAYQTVAQARLRPEIVSLLLVTQRAAWLALVLTVTAAEAPLGVVAAAYVVSIAVQASLQWSLCRGMTEVRLRGVGPSVRRLYRDSWPFGLASMFVLAYYGLDVVLVYRLAGPEESALYGAGYRFVDSLQLIPMTIIGVLLPMLSSLWHDDERRARAGRLFRLAQMTGIALSLPIAVGGSLLSTEIVDVVYGSDFAGSAPLARLLFLAFVPITMGYIYTGLLLASDRVRAYCTIAACAMVLNLTLNVVLIPRHGAIASAWLTLATELAVNACIAAVVLRGAGLGVPIAHWARTAVAVAAMALVVVGLRERLGLLTVVPAGLVYAGAVVVLRGIDIGELRRAIERGSIDA